MRKMSLLALLVIAVVSSSVYAARPNVVMLLADDLGFRDKDSK